jgi:hypothetical protein
MSLPPGIDALAPAPTKKRVHPTHRMWDIAALVLVACGVGLFFLARQAIRAIATGSYDVPSGMSHVAMTDLRVAQTRLGLWLVAFGVAIGVVAALKHRLRRA